MNLSPSPTVPSCFGAFTVGLGVKLPKYSASVSWTLRCIGLRPKLYFGCVSGRIPPNLSRDLIGTLKVIKSPDASQSDLGSSVELSRESVARTSVWKAAWPL